MRRPRDYIVTLTVRTEAPVAALRDVRAYYTQTVDQHFSSGGLAARYALQITRVEVKEIEPWDTEAQPELGECE